MVKLNQWLIHLEEKDAVDLVAYITSISKNRIGKLGLPERRQA